MPFTASAKALLPTDAEFGLKLVMMALAMLKFIELELTPSAVFTVTPAKPAVTREEAGTTAVQ